MRDTLNIGFVLAAELKFGVAFETQEVLTIAMWAHGLDPVAVHYR